MRAQNGQFLAGHSATLVGVLRMNTKWQNWRGVTSAEAIETLVDLMRNAKDDRVRGTAAQALLDRGWGKPKLEVSTSEKPEGYLAALQAVSERVKARGK